MSKASAKSKGYRNYKKEKPFLTKKELYALIAIVVVVLVAFIAFISYDDGALKLENNVVMGTEPNWLVANCGTITTPRYFKLAEAGEMEDYQMSTSTSYTDSRLKDIYYFPTDEANPINYISIGTSSVKTMSIAEMGATVTKTLAGIEGYTLSTPLTETKVGDIPYTYYSFNTALYVEPAAEEVPAEEVPAEEVPAEETAVEETAEVAVEEAATEEAVEEENAPNTFGQSMSAYVGTAYDACLLVRVVNETDSAEELLSDDELKAILEDTISAIVLEK